MENFGFIRVAAAVPLVKVADCEYNAIQILSLIKKAEQQKIQLVCFPELSITAYTCGDLFHQQLLIKAAETNLNFLLKETAESEITFIVGLPILQLNRLFNVAVVCQRGKILGAVPKLYLPNNNEFYEKRWFTPGKEILKNEVELCNQTVPFGSELIFSTQHVSFAIEICEDLWLPQAPSTQHALNGAQLIFNLSASNELIGKNIYRKQLIAQQSAKCIAAYVYSSAGFGESTTDLVFTGNAYIAENGIFLAESERFSFDEQLTVADIDVERLAADRLNNSGFIVGKSDICTDIYRNIRLELPPFKSCTLLRKVNPHPFVPPTNEMEERCNEIFSIQVGGLATRLFHTGIKKVVLGISGGLDSTLALLVCIKTFDKLNLSRKNIIGITMPGFGTTDRTYNNAVKMMRSLGITDIEIDITAACKQHFKDIGHDENEPDVTYENTQARERTQILMDYANKVNGLVIGTGDLSELALGWATYNGDQMSMYGVNSSIPKTLVRYLIRYIADTQVDPVAKITLGDVIDTPVSPELLPKAKDGKISQKTEDLVGPYELHDFFIYNTLRFGFSPSKIYVLTSIAFDGKYSKEIILKWMKTFYRRFFYQQFKRSAMPDGPKVGSVNLSPRGDWRMPSDASPELWLREVEHLK
jgi:NAD+ synthase (glutamine-hydrolysing)